MNEQSVRRNWSRVVSSALWALSAAACGGAVASGSAVGRAGQDLNVHAQNVPQGSEVCAMKEGLNAQSGGPEKPISETCSRPVKDDQLWRRSMVVLAAYGDTLDAMATGDANDMTGPTAAARTGVDGKDWIQAEGAPEQAAKEA